MFFTKHQQGNKEARPPRFKSTKYFFTQNYSQREVSFKIEDQGLKLAYGSKPSDWLSIPLPPGSYETVKTVSIHYDQDQKKWYACLTYFVQEAPLKTEGASLYFDPGCKTALTGIKTTG
jgi:transposase